ncbi:MAG: outer membrane lipoprotein carrier protein LolA [Acidobacteriota bacterium]
MRMKFFLSVVILLAMVSISASAVPSFNGVEQILANMQNAAKNIKTLQANISQVTRHTQIGGPASKYNGTVIFQRGASAGREKAIVKYTNGQQVAVVGDSIVVAQPNIKQEIHASRAKLASENDSYSFIAVPFASTDSLKAKFDISYSRDEGNSAVLELTPKVPNIQRATIWVDKGSWMPVKFKTFEKNGDETLFTLSGIQTGIRVDGNTFKVSCPGCKVTGK